jgi:plastocyanin
MRLRVASLVVLTALGLVTAGAPAASRTPKPAGAHAPARMLVYAQEWSLWPSRHTVPHGRVIVQLWNRGQDGHDLHIRRLDRRGHMVGRSQTVALTLSGAISQASWHLAPGRYELFCSMPGHRALGMHTILLVR